MIWCQVTLYKMDLTSINQNKNIPHIQSLTFYKLLLLFFYRVINLYTSSNLFELRILTWPNNVKEVTPNLIHEIHLFPPQKLNMG